MQRSEKHQKHIAHFNIEIMIVLSFYCLEIHCPRPAILHLLCIYCLLSFLSKHGHNTFLMANKNWFPGILFITAPIKSDKTLSG